MRRLQKTLALFFVIAASSFAKPPHIGYAYPAGGQQGTSFRVIIGGQYLQGATNVLVSGGGVTAKVVRHTVKYDPKRYRQFWRSRKNAEAALKEKEGTDREKLQRQFDQTTKQIARAELPEGIDPFDEKAVTKYYRMHTKEQFNPQIADRLRIDVTIARDAPPGVRELRVYTPGGLSNPLYFEVGTLPETMEEEPNDDHMAPDLQEVILPTIINGQILPGDIDHFRFKALKGQSIVVNVGARKIIPYLADAVPGWFQAVVTLYDEEGKEVAYQDDYEFNPDPVLFFDVPKMGTYTLSIKDSIYRGREDFIYRIALGELPFITSIFPLGGQKGENIDIALCGKNLPKKHIHGAIPDDDSSMRYISVKKSGYRSNAMPFALDRIGDQFEIEPNDTPEQAQSIHMPIWINGRIQQVGDVDTFSFSGKKGDLLSIEVAARRLNSPLDSVIELTGPGLKNPVRNDDNVDIGENHLFLGAGLVTHHADSYLLQKLPATGTYYVQIGDTQSKGGNDYAYRLRISPAHPDFKLYMNPSGLKIAPGGTDAFTVRAIRLDGFDGQIQLEPKSLPPGFTMSKSTIAADSDIARFTITAPRQLSGKIVSPEIIGIAQIDNRSVTNAVTPVDDQMQAFLYRHLVPAQELVLAPVEHPARLVFHVKVPKSGIIKLPLGKEITLSLEGRVHGGFKGAKLELDHPPEGIVVSKSWVGRKRLKGKTKNGKPKFDKNLAVGRIKLKAEAPLKPGFESSLIISAVVRKGREEIRFTAPAVPFKVVESTQ